MRQGGFAWGKAASGLTLMLCIAATAVVFRITTQQIESRADAQFHNRVNEIVDDLANHMAAYEQVQRGAVGLFDASQFVDRNEWRAYYNKLNIEEKYPGIRGLGFIKHVPIDELEAHIIEQRQNGQDDYDISPTPTTESFPLVYSEPLSEQSRRFIGFDLGSEPTRRSAFDQARDSGEARMTAPIKLVTQKSTDESPSFLLVMPVYTVNTPISTVDQRREALTGFVVASFRAEDFFDALLKHEELDVAFEVSDGQGEESEQLMYRTAESRPDSEVFASTIRTMDLAGRTWRLRFQTMPVFEQAINYGQARLVLAAGIAVTTLLAGIVLMLGSLGERAEHIANRMTRSLRESEERMELAFSGSQDGIWDWLNVNESSKWWSPQFYALLGYEPGEIEPTITNFRELLHPEDRNDTFAAIQRHFDGEESFDVTFRLRMRDSEYRWFQARAVVVRDDDGHPQRMVGSITDVHEKVTATQQLSESEERFELAVTGSNDGLWDWDIHTNDVWYSSRFKQLLGYEDHAFPHRFEEFARRLHNADRDATIDAVHRHIQYGEPYDVECRLRTRSDEFRWYRARGRAIRDRKGQAVRMAGSLSDITERKQREAEIEQYVADLSEMRAELEKQATELAANNHALERANAEAEAANKTKSAFLANMSHEIRTPMTAIMGYADLLLDHDDATEDQRLDYTGTIRRNCEHLLIIINDILDISKIEAGRMEIEKISCSPHEVIEDVAALLRPRAEGGNIALEIEYRGRLPRRMQSDPTRLRQILLNLAGNAIKFTEHGEVRIAANSDIDEQTGRANLRFDVIDTGIGLTPEQQSKLFQPFTQADASTTRKFGGTGLGLTICRRLAELLGGRIELQSQPGQGSTFTLLIDAGHADDLDWVEPHEVRHPTRKRQTVNNAERQITLSGRILLAEDGPDNQRLIGYILRKAGADLTIAENGRIACDLARQSLSDGEPFGLIFMDMQMPEMDGYEATRHLREQGWSGPIIALTAHAMTDQIQQCIEVGCDDVATKPIERLKLIEMAADALKRSRAEAA